MTDEERTPTQAAEGAQAEQASAETTAAASEQEQTESQGLLAKLAGVAKSAASTVTETTRDVAAAVVERAPDVAENIVGAAKHLVGREHTHAPDGSTQEVESTSEPQAPAATASSSEPATSEGASSGVVETAKDAAETVTGAAQTAAATVQRLGARVYSSVVGGAEADRAQAPATAETSAATAETPAEGSEAAGASFEPTEATAKSGKPRRFKDVQAGMQLEGKVTSIALYGVFVDVGVGRDGLVHISEMSEIRIESPTELVQIGDPVTVWVKSVDADARRISLTMRDPHRPKPQRERRGPRKPEIDRGKLAEMKAGDVIEGVISSLAPFGAFVDIGVGKDGLVHISELAEGRIEKAEDAVQVGERYTFKVLEVDPEGKRISLSLRRAQRTQRMQQLEPGTLMDGTVSGIAPFGAFVDVGVGRDGLVHISELTAERVGSVEEAVSVGDKVQVKVIEIDPNSKRISLTMRVDEALPKERERPAGRVGGGYGGEVAAPEPAFTPSFGGAPAGGPGDTGRGGFGGGRGDGGRGRGSFGAGRGDAGRGEAGRGDAGRGRGDASRGRGERDTGRGGRLGGRPETGRSRREPQIFEPSEEVYTFEDPVEETFSGDATLEDLVSKFNAGKDRRGKNRRDDDEDEDGSRGNGRRDAIRRTLALRDED